MDYLQQQLPSFTEKLGFTTVKQPEHVSWFLNIVNCSQNIISWVKENPWTCICLIFLCICLIWFCGKYSVNVSKKKKKRINKTENFCRSIVEKMFNKRFPSVRPDWLNNQKTQKNLELDMYNEQLKLAFEYDGQQHASFNKFYHKTIEDFNDQVERDKFKNDVCEKNGITLVRIPHSISKDKMKDYIISECKRKGITLPK